MALCVGLRAITIQNHRGTTIHGDLLVASGEHDVFKLDLVQYYRTVEERRQMAEKDTDIAIRCRAGYSRFVFLNIWLLRLLVSLRRVVLPSIVIPANGALLAIRIPMVHIPICIGTSSTHHLK